MSNPSVVSPALSLLSAAAVRARADRLLEIGLAGELRYFTVDLSKLPAVADRVIALTRHRYPDLAVPLHSRWRHFEAGGVDRWDMLASARGFDDVRQMGRAAFDLAIVSCLTDAAAGAGWTYMEDATGLPLARSEGLAVATLAMFASGFFSANPADPLRADAHALMRLEEQELAEGFKTDAANPLAGLAGRVALLIRLGEATGLRPDLFATRDDPRPGGLFDILYDEGQDGPVPASRILDLLLDGLGPVWPDRIELEGVGLGDTWRHAGLVTPDVTSGLVPLHTLSQWMAWSLIEPLAWAGVEVSELDGLTGLAEHRNGGLFLDAGVISLCDPADAALAHAVDSELVVEWRALTVALLDRLADQVRMELEASPEELPLGCILEGGTWAAGREIAREKREDGTPPLTILSDGTVF